METNVFKGFVEKVLEEAEETEYDTEPGLRSSSGNADSKTQGYFSHSEPNTERGV